MNKPLKISLYILGVIIVLAIIAVAIAYFYPQVYIMATARIEFPIAKDPNLYATPIHRDLQPEAVSNSQEIKYSDFTFDVPWLQKPTTPSLNNGTAFSFGKGNLVLIINATGTDLKTTMSNELEKEYPGRYNDASIINTMFGSNSSSTQYDFLSYILNTTPYSISLSDTKSGAVSKMVMLTYKGIVSQGDSDIYSFETPYVEGFQFGDSSPSSFYIFDNYGRSYNLLIGGTQSEIDYILSSIRPTQ